MIITVTIALHGEWWMEWLIDSNFWLSDFYLALNLDFRKFVYSDLHHINENKTHLGPHIHHEMMVRFIFAVGRVELEINITKSPSYRSYHGNPNSCSFVCVIISRFARIHARRMQILPQSVILSGIQHEDAAVARHTH
jgi:hypothetical protein